MEEFTLMKLPRFSGVTLDVTIAMAGTHRPEVSIMNIVVTVSTIQRGTRGKFVTAMIGIIEHPMIHAKAFLFPMRSESLPKKREVKIVAPPPSR